MAGRSDRLEKLLKNKARATERDPIWVSELQIRAADDTSDLTELSMKGGTIWALTQEKGMADGASLCKQAKT